MVIAIKIMLRNERVYMPFLVHDQKQNYQQDTYQSKDISNPVSQKQDSSTKIKTISVGKEFIIKPNEKVIIADSYGATFMLTGFYNHPCPGECVWSGLDIFYTIQLPMVKNANGTIEQQAQSYIKDQPIQTPKDLPFQVIVQDSDYETYAKIILQIQGKNN